MKRPVIVMPHVSVFGILVTLTRLSNPMRDKNSQAANGSVMICLCHNFDRNVFLKSDLMAWIHF